MEIGFSCETSGARSEDHRADESSHTAGQVNDATTGEINIAIIENVCEQTATPRTGDNARIDHSGHDDDIQEICRELNTLRNTTGYNSSGRGAKRPLKEKARVVNFRIFQKVRRIAANNLGSCPSGVPTRIFLCFFVK